MIFITREVIEDTTPETLRQILIDLTGQYGVAIVPLEIPPGKDTLIDPFDMART